MASLLSAAPTLAADLVKVRIGQHPDFTRIVFQLDGEATYRIREEKELNQLIVELTAGSNRRVITSRAEFVESVRVVPAPDGAVAHIQLSDPVQVADMVLQDPPRIVLDLRAPEPQPVEPDPAIAIPSEPESPPVEVALGDAPVGDDATPARDGREQPAQANDPSEDAPPAEVAAEPAPPVEPAEPGAVEVAAGEPDGGVELGQPVAPRETEPSDAGETPVAVTPTSPTSRHPVPPTPESDGSILSQLSEFRLAVAIAGLVASAGLLFAWRRKRRNDGEDAVEPFLGDEEPGAEPVVEASYDESAGGYELPDVAAEPEPTEDRPLETLPVEEGSIFDSHGVEDLPHGEEKPMDPSFEVASDAGASAGAAAVAAGITGSDRKVEELERRMAQLEKRLEEVLDAKDRLERHVSAQTEELRVQRAAIARTQRVLRNLTRADDAPTEPALKE